MNGKTKLVLGSALFLSLLLPLIIFATPTSAYIEENDNCNQTQNRTQDSTQNCDGIQTQNQERQQIRNQDCTCAQQQTQNRERLCACNRDNDDTQNTFKQENHKRTRNGKGKN